MSRDPKPTLFIPWASIFNHLADDKGQQRSYPHLAFEVIPALRMIQGFGYQLALFDPMEFSTYGRQILESQGLDLALADCFLGPTNENFWTDLLSHELRKPRFHRQLSRVMGDSPTAQKLSKLLGLLPMTPTGLTWMETSQILSLREKKAHVQRKTLETQIDIQVDLNQRCRPHQINTGLGFFDHMLDQIAQHAGISLIINAEGDLHIDDHHLVEDTALALGAALKEALGERRGIVRYSFLLPMDESLAFGALDLSGRAHFSLQGFEPWNNFAVGKSPQLLEKAGVMTSPLRIQPEMVPHFFQSLSQALGASLHMGVKGQNCHHQTEALFKCFGRLLGQAVRNQVPPPMDLFLSDENLNVPWKSRDTAEILAEIGILTPVPSSKGQLF